MGSARVGSNPILVEFFQFPSACSFAILQSWGGGIISVQPRGWGNFTASSSPIPQGGEKIDVKKIVLKKSKDFRYRESNPGHLGESQIS